MTSNDETEARYAEGDAAAWERPLEMAWPERGVAIRRGVLYRVCTLRLVDGRVDDLSVATRYLEIG